MAAKSQLNPPAYSSIGVVNTQRWRSLQLGSTAGHATARGVARIYNGLPEPGRVLSEALRSQAASPPVPARCPILNGRLTFGPGFHTPTDRRPPEPNHTRTAPPASGAAVVAPPT